MKYHRKSLICDILDMDTLSFSQRCLAKALGICLKPSEVTGTLPPMKPAPMGRCGAGVTPGRK